MPNFDFKQHCALARLIVVLLAGLFTSHSLTAIAGGGKGAAIGAGSGAGAGALTQILTKGTIKVPVESVLTFKLEQPLRVRAAE